VDNTTDLLWIKFRGLVSWHIVHEEVISDLRVSIYSFLVSLCNSLGEDSWVFRIEEEIDSSELNVLTSHVPLATVDGSFVVPLLDEDSFPLAGAILVLVETLSRNRVEIPLFIYT